MTERGWDAVTFEGVRRAQLREQMLLTPSERLRWLEEALRFAAMVRRRDPAHPGSEQTSSPALTARPGEQTVARE